MYKQVYERNGTSIDKELKYKLDSNDRIA